MSDYQQHLHQPPALPLHNDHMSPSPTPTVKPQHNEDNYTLDEYGEKQGLLDKSYLIYNLLLIKI